MFKKNILLSVPSLESNGSSQPTNIAGLEHSYQSLFPGLLLRLRINNLILIFLAAHASGTGKTESPFNEAYTGAPS